MVQVYKSAEGQEQVLQSYERMLGLWDAPYRETDIATRWGTTHCVTAGNPSNPPLLLFHGVGDNSAVMWFPNIRTLSQEYHCIAVDTLGGPGKSVPNEHFNKREFDQMAWIGSIADQLGLERFHVAGVSHGAYLACRYAMEAPERIIKAVCLEGGIVTKPLRSMLATLFLMMPEILIPTRHNLLRILAKLSAPEARLIERYPEMADHMVLLMRLHNQQAMMIHKLAPFEPARADAVKNRMLFLLGGYRPERTRDLLRIIQAHGFPHAIIQGAGHGINHEQPDTVHREMLRFLAP